MALARRLGPEASAVFTTGRLGGAIVHGTAPEAWEEIITI